MSRRSRSSIYAVLLAAACVVPGCRKSPTAKQIKKFADKVCACQDAACAKKVEAEYLAWSEENRRARGSESDRKGVEKAMQQYAACHLKLVGPESASPTTSPSPGAAPAPVVPKVNLAPAAPQPEAAPTEAAQPEPPPSPASGDTAQPPE